MCPPASASQSLSVCRNDRKPTTSSPSTTQYRSLCTRSAGGAIEVSARRSASAIRASRVARSGVTGAVRPDPSTCPSPNSDTAAAHESKRSAVGRTSCTVIAPPHQMAVSGRKFRVPSAEPPSRTSHPSAPPAMGWLEQKGVARRSKRADAANYSTFERNSFRRSFLGASNGIGRRGLLDDDAAVHEDRAVGDLAGEAHLVRHEHHRHAALGEIADDLQHLPTISGSRALVASSNSMISGSIASARAIATRCF